MVLTVGTDGQIQATGDLSGKADNPMVQVLFEDNKNNEWNQAEWIKTCLLYLKENYGIDKVNIDMFGRETSTELDFDQVDKID